MNPTIIKGTDENVVKLVFDFGNSIAEAVLYKYPTYSERIVICCSTQSGCPIGCRFCGSGDFFVRNLTADEIVHQVESAMSYAHEKEDFDIAAKFQIMFMSMGEPLLNFKNLSAAMKTLNHWYPTADLLISSVGPETPFAFKELADLSCEIDKIGLQFSVHESTDEARNALIPFDKKMNLKQISSAGEYWAARTGRRPFFNYCVHSENNTYGDVFRLKELFDPETWNCTLSVICESDEGVAASNQRQRDLIETFSSLMVDVGYNVRLFDPAGQDDIGGGCGQLWFVQEWMRDHPEYAKPSCGNGLDRIHCPS